jgi:hypothetical protein
MKTYSLRIQRMKNNVEKPQKHLQNKEKRQMNTNPRPSKPIGVIRVNSRNSWTKTPSFLSVSLWFKNIFTTDSTDLTDQTDENNAEKRQKHLQNKEKHQMNTKPRPSKPIGVIRVNSCNSWTKPPCHPGDVY